MVEPFEGAGKVAHAIAISVGEAARGDLVDDGATLPASISHY